ncbi:hypothetical protein MBLNU457_6250t1 [Dothideomycetes sp. NU457]
MPYVTGHQDSDIDMTLRRRTGFASKPQPHQDSSYDSHEEDWELVSISDRIYPEPDTDRKPDDVQKPGPNTRLPDSSDWRVIHVVPLPAQQQCLYAWKRLEICSHDTVKRVDLGYGHSATEPEYYISCHVERQTIWSTRSGIAKSIEKVMIQYLEHRRRWACNCSLVDLAPDRRPDTQTFHGPTPALEAAGLKHFLLDSSPATKRRDCPSMKVNHFVRAYHEFTLRNALIGHGSCRCGCLGKFFWGDEMQPLSKNPKEG